MDVDLSESACSQPKITSCSQRRLHDSKLSQQRFFDTSSPVVDFAGSNLYELLNATSRPE